MCSLSMCPAEPFRQELRLPGESECGQLDAGAEARFHLLHACGSTWGSIVPSESRGRRRSRRYLQQLAALCNVCWVSCGSATSDRAVKV